jgi:hypothetical protein
MAKRFFITISVLVILLAISVGSVFAGSTTVSGAIAPGGPTTPVIFISSPNCTGQGATPVLYAVHPLNVDVAGVYNFSLLSDAGFASLYLFAGSFNPAGSFGTCIAGDNSGNPVTFSVPLDPAVNYFVVPFDDTFAQAGGGYTLTVDGPGFPDLHLPLADSDICSTGIPDGTVIGEAPLGAHVYWAPGQESPGIVLNPGTYHVIGQDASETYYKLFFNCQYIWVRKDTMQPSYLPPQNGAPLPQRIVS